MSQAGIEDPDIPFSRFLLQAVLFHICIVAAFVIKTIYIPNSEPFEIESAVRVDIVSLPDKLPQTQLPIEDAVTDPVPVDQPKPVEDKVVLKKNAKKSALEKLKALQALEKFSDDEDRAEKKKMKNKIMKGNVISAGTALSGVAKSQFNGYLDGLSRRVKANWNLPQWMADGHYRAKAVIFVDERGNIMSRAIKVSSGNSTYDEYVLNAIDQSSPLPPPPEKFVEIVRYDGVVLGFPE